MSFYRLYGDVISKNLCTDCGACMLVCPKQVITLEESELSFEPALTGKCLGEKCNMCIEICPGAYVPRTDIERKILGRTRKNDGLEKTQGVMQKVCIAQWKGMRVLQTAGSGGVVTGLLVYALEKGLIDGAVLAGPREGKPWLSQARLATTPQEVIKMAGSRYDSFPQLIGLAAALDKNLKQVAIVGLPCHIQALRKMELGGRKYQKWTKRVKYRLGLWCIGNFSRNGIEAMIQNRLGVPLNEVSEVQYRARPFPGQFTVTTKTGKIESKEWVSRHLLHRLASSYMLESCLECTDAQCDFADISFGDPWGHPIDQEALRTGIGFSTALVRTGKGRELIDRARTDGMFNFFKELKGKDRNFLTQTGAVITKCYGHQGFINQRQRHGLPVRVVA